MALFATEATTFCEKSALAIRQLNVAGLFMSGTRRSCSLSDK
jgi:hypothetical protein